MINADTIPRTAGRRPGRPVGSDAARPRTEILQVARRMIAERGYPAMTFQGLATESGFSRTTLHYHFSSLDAIYQTLMSDAAMVAMRCIALASLEPTLPDQLAAYVAEFGRTGLNDRAMVALLVSSRLTSSQAPAPTDDPAVEVRTFLVQAVTNAIARGELAPHTEVTVMVDLLYAILWGIGFYAGFTDDADHLESITRQLGNVLRFGLLSPHP